MNRIRNAIPLFGGVIFLLLSGCASTSTNRQGNSSTQTPVASQSSPAPTPISQNTVAVNIYRPDSQCEALVSEKVSVPGGSSLEAAVGKVLQQRNNADFNLSGYRVSVNPKNGIATVDMRLAPNSKRKFVSLSSCEQFALFGSLRKTLTGNQGFKIKDVRFTEQGQEISL